MKRQFTTLAISRSPPPFPSPLCKDKQFSRNCECSHNLPRPNAIYRPLSSTNNNDFTGGKFPPKWVEQAQVKVHCHSTSRTVQLCTLQTNGGMADKTKLQGRAKNLGCSFFLAGWLMNPLQATGGVSPFKPLWRALANPNVCFDYHIAPLLKWKCRWGYCYNHNGLS